MTVLDTEVGELVIRSNRTVYQVKFGSKQIRLNHSSEVVLLEAVQDPRIYPMENFRPYISRTEGLCTSSGFFTTIHPTPTPLQQWNRRDLTFFEEMQDKISLTFGTWVSVLIIMPLLTRGKNCSSFTFNKISQQCHFWALYIKRM